jgi:DNA-binding PadR family transcriptional regulator
MSSTRLLVLGVVRFMQPTYGYDVRRELISWGVEDWANIKPASIYSALRTLEKDGLLRIVPEQPDGSRPARTSYEMTAEGEKEFQLLLRKTWWTVAPTVEPLLPGLTMMTMMPRAELIAAVEGRVGQLRSDLERNRFFFDSIADGATGEDGNIPEHVRELLRFTAAKAKAELDWSRSFLTRLRAGEYQLLGDGSGRGE